VLVVGDYNMIPGQDQTNFDSMNPDDYLTFISYSLSSQCSHISASGTCNLLDGYAVSHGHTSEYIAGSIRIVPMHEILGLPLMNYRTIISDHLPLGATFRITDDDD
jgi:hypothetical protein